MLETFEGLLEAIDSPAQLRALHVDVLPRLATELREFLIDSIAQCGGHFGAGLGAVLGQIRPQPQRLPDRHP